MRKSYKVAGVLALFSIVFVLGLSLLVYAYTTIVWPDELLGFEETNPVYTEYVDLDTALENISLPATVRAFVSIPEDMDATTFVQAVPSVDSTSGTAYYDYYDYGYVAPDGVAELYDTAQLAIYSIFHADDSGVEGAIGYRIYGSIEGSVDLWFACDDEGNITGAVIDLPVIWDGTYDASTYGDYVFTATISPDTTYAYSGQMPTALIVVYDSDAVDNNHQDAYSVEGLIDDEVEATEQTGEAQQASNNGVAMLSLENEAIALLPENDIATFSSEYDIELVADADDMLTYTDNKYGYDETTGEHVIMADLISDYVTTSIFTSGNDETTHATGDWIDYLNTMWYNIVGAITTETDTENGVTESTWTSNVVWKETSYEPWLGTGEGTAVDDFIYDSVKAQVSGEGTYNGQSTFYSNGVWSVLTGEQLLYALLHYEADDTISVTNNIDLNGQYYCWPDIILYNSVTIEGNGYTIYNLSAFIDYTDADYSTNAKYADDVKRSGFLTIAGNGTYTIENLNFDTGKLYADTGDTSGADRYVDLSLFAIENSGATVSFDNVHIQNYLVCSNADAVSVFLSARTAADWGATLGYVSMSAYEFSITVNNCSVCDSYVYGNDHVGSIGTFTNAKYTNCYAVGNTLVGTGYHSGSFVSCLNNAAYFENCFAADNVLYSASMSGGFIGYGGDAADYIDCYASGIVEGYTYIGGFVGATSVGHGYISGTPSSSTSDDVTTYSTSYAMTSRNYNTFTNCYSTTLVGMRTATNNSGGFVGLVDYATDRVPVSATVFVNCYAAGEVGSTQTVNEENTEHVGGFVGYDETYTANNGLADTYQTVYINCYYDKQTTAMREWVSGRYNSTDDTHTYEIDIMGVLTSDTEKFGTGLISTPTATAHTDETSGSVTNPEYGFIGFASAYTYSYTYDTYTVDAATGAVATASATASYTVTTDDATWNYDSEEHYPQLNVFTTASIAFTDPTLVQAYSLASTATIILDTWDYGYNWNYTTGVRSDTKELYSGTYVSTADYIGDRFTYDTVREVVSNATITNSAYFEEMIDGGIITQSYWYNEDYQLAYDTSKNIVGYYTADGALVSYDYDKDAMIADGVLAKSKYYGISAFTLDNDANTLTVDAPGIDWYDVDEAVTGDDGTTVVGTRPIRLIAFMKVDAGDDQVGDDAMTASDTYDHREDASFTMVDTIKENMVVALDALETWSTSLTQSYPDNKKFFSVETVVTNFTASNGAWINTEIWSATPVGVGLSMANFTDADGDGQYAYAGNKIEESAVGDYYTIGQDGVLYSWAVDDTTGTATSTELYMTTTDAESNTFDLYSAAYSIKITSDDTMDVTQDKWNGEIPLYPEIDDTQYYIVRYYWVLTNGRYRSDYKIIEIVPDAVDIEISHDVTINVYNNDATEDTAAIQNDIALAVYADGYADYTEETPWFATTASASATTAIAGEDGQVGYGEHAYVSWQTADASYVVVKTVLTMVSNNGYEVGTVEVSGALSAGDVITIPILTFYLAQDDSDGTQTTQAVYTDVPYVVKQDASGGLYLDFDQETYVYVTEYDTDGNAVTGGEDRDPDDAVATINDTQYNIIFDIYVEQVAQITVTKQVAQPSEVEAANATAFDEDAMQAQSFIITLTGDVNTQMVLKDDETSGIIYDYLQQGETDTFYISEVIPMEFALYSITYTINYGAEQTYNDSDGITISPGDEIAITVTNIYTVQSYFKARDEVLNIFTDTTIADAATT